MRNWKLGYLCVTLRRQENTGFLCAQLLGISHKMAFLVCWHNTSCKTAIHKPVAQNESCIGAPIPSFLAVGSMALHAATKDVSKSTIVSIVFILVGAMQIVTRRRSYNLILYIIITTILLICAFLIFAVLNVPSYIPLGTYCP